MPVVYWNERNCGLVPVNEIMYDVLQTRIGGKGYKERRTRAGRTYGAREGWCEHFRSEPNEGAR